MVKWTPDQQSAIRARNSNLLVAAAAGSGKTAVLVERIIQLIVQDKVDIDRLLIVTFTNAAAGEMRERIGLAILEELEKKNENEDHLRRQMSLLNRAFISTIHSFCIDVMRKYFHLIDVDPNFRIGDGTETNIMKLEVLEELFEKAYKQGDEYFIGLVERFGGGKGDQSLQELVLKLYEFIQSKPYPKEWLLNSIERFSIDATAFEKSPWVQEITGQLLIQLAGAKGIFIEAQELCKSSEGLEGYLEAIQNDIFLVEDLITRLHKGLDTFYDGLKGLKHKRLGRVNKDVDQALKEEISDLRQQGKDLIKDIQKNVFYKEPQAYSKDLNELYPYMLYLYKLVESFEEDYHRRKVEKGIVDFNDLEHYTLKILENKQVAKEYQDRFQYIFVDEYQDSNIVQETLLNFIKKENNLFMVGDVKQSIYRFRLADPSLFIEKYQKFDNCDSSVNRRIDLSKNFRSRKEVVDGVNFIFKHIMTKNFGEVDYDEKAYLYQGADTQPIDDPTIEINLIEKDEIEKKKEAIDREEFKDIEELKDIEAEAKMMAKRIKEILQKEIYDTKIEGYRKVTYRDIAVLLRTTRNWAQTFLETFIAEGIPAYADVNTGYFEAIEVNIFINLLKLIDNKRQDIPLLSVMRSSIGGFSIEDLIKIRIHSNAKTYFEAIEEYIHQKDDELKDRLMTFFAKIEDWKEESRYSCVDAFIWKLLMDTGYYYYVGSMPGGIQRQANLRILIDRANQFQETSIRGLFNFIRFIDKLKKRNEDMGTAKTLGENDNVVRIMSIHKSKGLEFPIVMIPQMGKPFNLSDVNASILFHKDLGIGPRYVDPEWRQYTDTIARIAMKNRIRMESLSEEMRILYVALTRAKDKLILMGSIKSLKNAGKQWIRPINAFNLLRGKNYLDWIGPVLIRHPDGSALRKWTEVEERAIKLLEDPSKWTIKRIYKNGIQAEERERRINKLAFQQYLKNFRLTVPAQEASLVEDRLNWQYTYEAATKIPSKLSVTEIMRLSAKELEGVGVTIPALIKRPKFVEEKKQFTGLEKGIIIHFVMQHLNFNAINDIEAIKAQVQTMIGKELLKPEEATAVDAYKILKFFQTQIGQRILQAEKVYREMPFVYVKQACDIIPDLEDCSEKLLIQGVIDCFFEEEDGLILVDYKTNYVDIESKEEIIRQYSIQMELYKEALTHITGKNVKERYLYLFHLDEEVKL